MKLLKRIFRGFPRIIKGQMGYTLTEVAAVVAVTATLTAVAIPVAVDKVKEGKVTSADQDIQQIATAISGFYKDVGEWPAHTSDGTTITKDKVSILTSGSSEANNPELEGTWSGTQGLLEDYLVTDDIGYVSGNYNWKGPYIESLQKKRDPWGNNYLVWVYAMYTHTSDTNKQYGWILSAGPNGKVETAVTNNALGGDDIGFVLFSDHGKL